MLRDVIARPLLLRSSEASKMEFIRMTELVSLCVCIIECFYVMYELLCASV